MSLSTRSIAVKGFGFGALAVAVAGFVAIQTPAQTTSPSAGGGSPYLVFNVPEQPKVDHKLIAMRRAEEEILLAIIVNAVTNNLLDG